MLFLGLDGGGTKTAALLVNSDGQVVGSGKAGGSNYHTVGIDAAYASVQAAVAEALAGRQPDAACFSMAAADLPHDFAKLTTKLTELPLNCPFTVRNDVLGALRAGSRFAHGAVVVCGTSYNAAAISKSGREFRLPALGPISGDVAGGRRLATRALGAAFRSWDGRGEPTLMADLILSQLGAPDFDTVANRWGQNQISDEQLKSLAPLVFEASEAGDVLARQFVYEQALELGISANAVLRQTGLQDTDCDVVLAGSIFYAKGTLLMETLTETIHAFASGVQIKRLSIQPVVGAVQLAADSAGVQFPDQFIANLPETLRIPSMF